MNPQEIIAEVVDHARGMWRYRWWSVGAAWLVFSLGWLYAYSLPPVYSASAQVFVDTNSLIGPLMRGLTATQDTIDEVRLVGRAVLARPNLERIANETGLALRAETTAGAESLVSELQRKITVRGARDNIFEIEYTDTSREMAQNVVAAILDTFVEGTLGNQGDDAEVTEEALASEIRQHEERLLTAEARLANFKRENIGYMPDEYGDYAARLQAALADVRGTEERIRLLTERRDALRRQLEGEQPIVGAPSIALCSLNSQLGELTSELSTLSVMYTDKHPRVMALRASISQLEQTCTAELESRLEGPAQQSSAAGADAREANPVYQDLRIQLNNAEVELAAVQAELASQRARVEELRADVDEIAHVETELRQLNRDYTVVQGRHQELLSRWEALQAKRRLDPITNRVQFQSIQPPFALPYPVGPNRAAMLLGFLIISVGAGVALPFGLNRMSPVFFSSEKLRRAVPFAVLGSVTFFDNPRALRRRVAVTVFWCLMWAGLVAFALATIAFANYGSEVFRRALGIIGA